ncbi:MAG: NAD(P)/FAD-dependent oxidoreductase [Acetobacteraceae bacterium]|nr:NAD(P)/FAD-dependent oxidoreductase [Acetobacteraceae bacterium]
MSRVVDAVVIGAGPAGLSAARVIAVAGLSVICIERLAPGGEINNLGVLHGYPVETSGPELSADLLDRATEAGVELAFAEVRALHGGSPWTIETEEESYEAASVVLATGLEPGRLGIPEEARFIGRGISHCASCDGPLYGGERVVVVGGDRWAVAEALDLAATVAHVTLVTPAPDGVEAERLAALPNATILAGRAIGLLGADGIDAVVVDHDGARTELPARGVFVYAGRRPAPAFAADLFARGPGERLLVDADLRASRPGAYAVGDIRAGAPELISAAVADGERAGEAIVRQPGTKRT